MAPSQSTITLFAAASSVGLNGTVDVTATVIESAGTPVQNGTVVTFFTTLGTVEPAEARTQNGKATVRFHAGGLSGTATVKATSGGITSGGTTSGGTTTGTGLVIAVGAAAAARVEVSASPASLPSGGGTVQLTAVVFDTGGGRLAGVPVSFVADNGSVSPSNVTTDGNGEGRSALTATTATSGKVTVKVTVPNGAATPVAQELVIPLRSAPTVTIVVATPMDLTEGQPVSMTFTVAAGTSGAAVRTAVADFGDGASQNLGTSGTSTATHVYHTDGTYTVTATATDAAGETTVATTSVVVSPRAAVSVTLDYLPAVPVRLGVTTFTAAATTVPAGTPISRYEWVFGDGTATRTTTGNSTTHVYTTSGKKTVRVRVVASDGSAGVAEIEIYVAA